MENWCWPKTLLWPWNWPFYVFILKWPNDILLQSNIYNTRNWRTHTKGSYLCNPITHFHKHSVKIRRSSLLINDTPKSKNKLLKDTRSEESHYRKLVFMDVVSPAQPSNTRLPYQWHESGTCGVHVTSVWVECCNVDTMTPRWHSHWWWWCSQTFSSQLILNTPLDYKQVIKHKSQKGLGLVKMVVVLRVDHVVYNKLHYDCRNTIQHNWNPFGFIQLQGDNSLDPMQNTYTVV